MCFYDSLNTDRSIFVYLMKQYVVLTLMSDLQYMWEKTRSFAFIRLNDRLGSLEITSQRCLGSCNKFKIVTLNYMWGGGGGRESVHYDNMTKNKNDFIIRGIDTNVPGLFKVQSQGSEFTTKQGMNKSQSQKHDSYPVPQPLS